jgi:NAD(P)H dehydrogenase (quinone)
MFAITGITGQVGGAAARSLLEAGQRVRAVVRDKSKGETWSQRGCELAVADTYDATALTEAFKGAAGVFVMMPPVFDPKVGFPEAHEFSKAIKAAIEAGRPGKVVYLSTIGADAKETNLLTQHTMIENAFRELHTPITFLRAAWFMENASWDVAHAQHDGLLNSFLQPLDRAVPMVSTDDIGKLAAELLRETWSGSRVIELEGPARYTPNDLAKAFSLALNRPVRPQVVPRESWEVLFRAQGVQNPMPRVRMLDGFNEGWIEFEHGVAGSRKGATELQTVITGLVQRSQAG